jgi:hypothetical protein
VHTKRPVVKPQIILGCLSQNASSPPYVFWQHLVKSITNHRKIKKKCKPNFVVLSIKNAKSIHDLELDFGYVMSTSFSSKIAQSYKRNLFINIIW